MTIAIGTILNQHSTSFFQYSKVLPRRAADIAKNTYFLPGGPNFRHFREKTRYSHQRAALGKSDLGKEPLEQAITTQRTPDDWTILGD